MIAYILRRLVAAVILLFVATFTAYLIFFQVPKLAGQTTYELAASYLGKSPTPQAVAAMETKLGLNDPLLVQYGRFVKGVAVGADYNAGPDKTHCPAPCFGYSFKDNEAVWPLLKSRIPVTASLALGAAIIWLVAGVGIGVLSALRRGSFFDRLAMSIALAGVSLPIFFTGLVSLALFSYKWEIFKDVQYVPFFDNPSLWAQNLVLPWVTLAFLYSAMYARMTRAGMLETMGEDYIRTARAKGLPERTVVIRHGLRSTLTPLLTIFGLDVGLLLGGAVLTESTFSLNGLGKFGIDAIDAKDLPEIMGVVVFVALFVVVANLIVDILYAVVDPRVRYS